MKELLEEIEKVTVQYREYGIEQALDWERFNHYAIVHHSTSIEGSSLTQEENELLLSEGITAKGKPMEHHHMNQDHLKALEYTLSAAKEEQEISIGLIKRISALVMKNTGSTYNTVLGFFDSSAGDLRLVNNYAGQTRFPDFKKVPDLLKVFCDDLNGAIENISTPEQALITSIDAHFNLVSIHPFSDGNGRVSRLIMNYVEHRFGVPLTIMHKEDKADYYKALVDTRKEEDIDIFRKFMLGQHKRFLVDEIDKVHKSQKAVDSILSPRRKNKGKGMGMMFC